MRRILSHPLILSLLLVIALVFLNYQGWLAFFKDFTLEISAYFQKSIYNTSNRLSELGRGMVSLPEIVDENQRLRQANLSLLGDMALLGEVLKENDFLRQQAQVKVSDQVKSILAEVVGQSLTQLDQVVLIDKGKADGLVKGKAVITAGNVLVGQIVEVYSNYAKVRLITDPNSQVNALIQGNGVSGLIIGQGQKDLLFDLLPQGENIEEGQVVISSAAANVFPKGLLVGKTKKVISLDSQISQKALVDPIFRISELEKVLIIQSQ